MSSPSRLSYTRSALLQHRVKVTAGPSSSVKRKLWFWGISRPRPARPDEHMSFGEGAPKFNCVSETGAPRLSSPRDRTTDPAISWCPLEPLDSEIGSIPAGRDELYRPYHRQRHLSNPTTPPPYPSPQVLRPGSMCTSSVRDAPNPRDRSNRGTHSNVSRPRSTTSTQRRGLRVIQWNAGGLSVAKVGELRRFLETANPPIDVVAIQETHLQPGRSVKLPGYHLLRADRTYGRRADARTSGGGLLTAIRAGIMHQRQPMPPTDQVSATELLAVDLFSQGGRRPILRIINLYAPPVHASADDQRPISLGLDRLSPSLLDKWILCADANAHHHAWDPVQATDTSGRELDEWAVTLNLVTLNSLEATRINPATGGLSSPDVTLVPSSLERRCQWRVMQDSMGSDHLPIDIHIGGCLARLDRKRRPSPRPSWNSVDWTAFGQTLDAALIAKPGPFNTATAASAAFVAAVNEAVEKAVPISSRPQPKWWWTPDCSRAIAERRRLRRIAMTTGDPVDLQHWHASRRRVRDTISSARRTAWQGYVSQLNARSNPSAVWRTIRSLDGRSDHGNQHTVLERGTRLYTSIKEKTQLFADTYAAASRLPREYGDQALLRSVLVRLHQRCPCNDRQRGLCKPFCLPELLHALSKLKPHKAAGPDGCPTEPLRHLTTYALSRLLDVANISWISGEVPAAWRRNIIVPVLKQGKPEDSTESYRPISLTNNIAKVVERLVATRLLDFLERHALLNHEQAGFRPGRSAEDQVLRLAESVCARFQEHQDKRTVLALIDFSRAFEKVWHVGLTHKLLQIGTPTCCVRWIRQFLSDRRSCVRINGTLSHHRILRAGVPQGAVLSPLLFLVCINDVVDALPRDVEVSLYADDVAIWAGAATIEAASAKVQTALHALEQWSKRWKFSINTEKSEAAAFALGTNVASLESPTLTVNGQALRCTDTPKFLGVTFDRRMTYRAHTEIVAKRMTARLQQLRRLAGRSWGCNARDLRAVYLAYIRSVADYCGACYLPAAAESTVQRLEVIQRQAARVITGCVASTPIAALEREARLMPLRCRGQQLAGCALVRVASRPTSDPLRRLLTDRHQVPRRLKIERSWLPRGAATVAQTELCTRDIRSRPGTLPLPPWERWPDLDVRLALAYQPDDASSASRREAAELTLQDLPRPDVTIWTDGSVSGL